MAWKGLIGNEEVRAAIGRFDGVESQFDGNAGGDGVPPALQMTLAQSQ